MGKFREICFRDKFLKWRFLFLFCHPIRFPSDSQLILDFLSADTCCDTWKKISNFDFYRLRRLGREPELYKKAKIESIVNNYKQYMRYLVPQTQTLEPTLGELLVRKHIVLYPS